MGAGIDARRVKTLEMFLGTNYTGGIHSNSIPLLNKAFDSLRKSLGTRLILLGPAKKIFPGLHYSLALDKFSLDNNISFTRLVQIASNEQPTQRSRAKEYWKNMHIILSTVGFDLELPPSEISSAFKRVLG